MDVVEAVGDIASVVSVPGAQPWLRGLTMWRGRLHTLLDAGLLFGHGRTNGVSFIVLKGLEIDTALAVDTRPRRLPEGESVDRMLDLATLAAHPALQPGSGIKEGA